jgi:RNA binding exosome subunit
MGIVYIVHSGLLKNGWCKIGKTNDDIDKLYDRYKTYYGDKIKIYYINCDCNDECENRLKVELNKIGCEKRADELFKIKLEVLKGNIRDILKSLNCEKINFHGYIVH